MKNIRNLLISAALCLTLVFIPRARATEPQVVFGSEFTFSNFNHLIGEYRGKTNKNHNKTVYFQKYEKWATEYCKTRGCKVTAEHSFGEYFQVTIEFKDGFKVHAGRDQNVIEFRMTPLTERQMVIHAKTIQETVFGGMKAIGMAPTKWYGSGHMNIDVKTAFGDNISLLRNFIVDYFNHPALADGILEKDYYNALPMAMFPEKSKNEFAELIKEADKGEIQSIAEFIDRYQRIIDDRDKLGGLRKGVSLYFPNRERLEIRALRAQNNFEEFQTLCKMFDSRREYLKKFTAEGHHIEWKRNVGSNNPTQALAQFYQYIKSTKLDWNIISKTLLPARYKILPVITSPDYAFQDIKKCPYFFKKQWQKLHNRIASRSGKQ